ncbi:MAG: DUF922 domain-containing protein [Phycisphaerales bacterium]|nr:DUF922 domain-containing protein [Phycisphaerales bacterium]
MKWFRIFLLIFLSGQSILAQRIITATVAMEKISDKPKEIVYRKNTRLSLSDFLGNPEVRTNEVALAYSGVSLRYSGSIKKGQIMLDIKLYAVFDRSKSWCLEKAKNDWTLAHEQRHFDITAINACRLYRALKDFSFTQNFEQEIKELQKKFQQLNEENQDEYDEATHHGINKLAQEEWNQKIIKTLEEYSDCFVE